MTRVRGKDHPWRSMSDEEMLRSAGLILTDDFFQREGITLAAILLFGKDSTIMSVLPQHKTDAIFRIQNVDRYDDRDVVITNLIESYDRLFAFGKKHLNDTFHLEGVQSVSARDHILREVVSNLLMHRDFSSGYVAKLVIEKDKLYTENANLSHGYGILNLATFDPFQKNPPISRVFREIGLADELGSGVRNTYKYTRMYSSAEPEFIEGDVFRIIIPLSEVATATVGPTTQVTTQDGTEKTAALIEFCTTPHSKNEMMEHLGLINTNYFRKAYLKPLIESGKLVMTIPDKPNSSKQKYVKAFIKV